LKYINIRDAKSLLNNKFGLDNCKYDKTQD